MERLDLRETIVPAAVKKRSPAVPILQKQMEAASASWVQAEATQRQNCGCSLSLPRGAGGGSYTCSALTSSHHDRGIRYGNQNSGND